MTTGSFKLGVLIETAHHENDNDNKNNDDNNDKNNNSDNHNNNNNYYAVNLLWISLTQWMPRTELRLSLIALWVDICLENTVEPIDTFYSFCRTPTVEI